MENILKDLNDKQIEAVKAVNGPVLIIAGPGSGKTKALTHRIAYMIASGIMPENILAVTFTNKASSEIKERVGKLLGRLSASQRIGNVGMGTFHSICAKILRQEARHLGYTKNYSIYDEEDQLSTVKKAMEQLDISNKKFNPYAILSRISTLKSELVEPDDFEPKANHFYDRIVHKIYAVYQQELKDANAMDFDDLIILAVKLFKKNPDILKKYQIKFQYILVDEYQDVNVAQYVLVKLLSQKHKNLFVIGDTDQSIYAFRNADFRNMLNFEKDFPEAKIIKLEQNYRSTKTILAAAQGIINNNLERYVKDVWTENSHGEKVYLKETSSEINEGEFVIEKIKQGMEHGLSFKDFTVLYRTHAQSRALEEVFLKNGFPYKIVGGLKFYERREIKDILAYLRLLANPNDFASMARIHNVPTRGIGKTSYLKFTEYVKRNSVNLIKSCLEAKNIQGLQPKIAFAFYELGKTMSELGKDINDFKLTSLIKKLIKKIGYEEYIQDGTEEGEYRWENIKELFTVTKKYDHLETIEALNSFLQEVALIQDADKLETDKNVVHMMTLHAAKGLEFPVVFLIGMEEGIFPHSRSMFSQQELEEERRLCYVGMTRAQQRLYLTMARQRMIFGSTQMNPPSRFIYEIPKDLIEFDKASEEYQYIYEE